VECERWRTDISVTGDAMMYDGCDDRDPRYAQCLRSTPYFPCCAVMLQLLLLLLMHYA